MIKKQKSISFIGYSVLSIYVNMTELQKQLNTSIITPQSINDTNIFVTCNSILTTNKINYKTTTIYKIYIVIKYILKG